MKIFTSATKLVLLFFTLVLGVGTLWKPEVFFKLFDYSMVAIVSFYFGQKTNIPVNESNSLSQ